MDSVNRYDLQALTESLGRSKENIVSKIGDLEKNPAALLELEVALARLRGATIFHDEDTAVNFIHFGVSDNIGLGLQGAKIVATSDAADDFPVMQENDVWNPKYGAPSTEGWNVPYYHGWKYWQNNIPSGEQDRVNNNYPAVKVNGAYNEVPLFLSARFLSFQNDTGSALNNPVIRFTLSSDYLEGIKVLYGIDSDVHMDAQVYWADELVQTYNGTNNSWDEIVGLGSPTLIRTTEVSVKRETNGDYTFEVGINISGDKWTNGAWLHVVMYWGWGYIPDTENETKAFDTGMRSIVELPLIIWQRKNFFRNEIIDTTAKTSTGINNSNTCLVAYNRTHYTRQDGQYDDSDDMQRYSLPFTSIELNDIDIAKDNVVPAILCVKTGKTPVYKVVYGPQVTPEFFPDKWEDCEYFPPIPADYVAVAYYIIGRTDSELYGVIKDYYNIDFGHWIMNPNDFDSSPILSKNAIVWMRQSLLNYSSPRLKDENLYSYLLSNLYEYIVNYRGLSILQIYLNAAFNIIIKGSRVPTNLIPSISSITDPTSMSSIIFRNLLKSPTGDNMVDDNGKKTAIYFSDDARKIIADIAGVPPSTEILRFDGNLMQLTGEKLHKANTFEIYQEPSSQCSVVDKNTPGTRVAQDYTFRLELEDEKENTLIKDWYIMASRYFLTQEEYAQQAISQDGVLGYFTTDTLNRIQDWRLYGYAGIIPDLFMGQSRTLYTKVVAPPDNTKITREQFVAQRADLSEEDLNEEISKYLEDGGEFYEPDLHQYSNKFVGIRNASLSVTKYSYASEPYWVTNITPWTMRLSSGAQNVYDLKADSFTIAQKNLAIGQLETFGQESNYSLVQAKTGSYIDFKEDYRAFKITPSQAFTANELKLHIKQVGTSTNTGNAGIDIYLYSSTSDGLPDTQLYVGETIKYTSLPTAFTTDVVTPFMYTFDKDTTYWLVLKKNAIPIGATIQIECDTSATESTICLKYNSPISDDRYIDVVDVITDDIFVSDATYSNGEIVLTNGTIGGKSYNQGDVILLNCNTSNNIHNGLYDFVTRGIDGGDKFLVRSAKATFDIISTSDVYARLKNTDNTYTTYKWTAVSNFVADTTSIKFVSFTADTWVTDTANSTKLVWVKLSTINPFVLGGFNRDDYGISTLAPPNKHRAVDVGYGVEGFWSFTVDKFDSPQYVCIYPRAVKDYNTTGEPWVYIPNFRDIHVMVRLIKGQQVINSYVLIPAGNTQIIQLGNEPVDGIVFMAVAKGLDKTSARVATISTDPALNINNFTNNTMYLNSKVTTIDGITLVNGDRVLIKDLPISATGNFDARYNGIYVYNAPKDTDVAPYATFVRASDLNDSSQLYTDLGVRVREGSSSMKYFYLVKYVPSGTQDDGMPIVLNNTKIRFQQTTAPTPQELASPYYGGYLGDRLVIRSS